MKKIISLIMIAVVIGLAIFAVIRVNKREDNNLKKITVADATITSLTQMK